MLKKLALGVSLLLSACIYKPEMMYSVTPTSGPLVGVGHNEMVEWGCSQEDTNQQTVFLECSFHNYSTESGPVDTCIRLSYWGIVNEDEIEQSRLVCSGPLDEDTVTKTYVSFQKQARKNLLIYCGENNAKCKLVINEVRRPNKKPNDRPLDWRNK